MRRANSVGRHIPYTLQVHLLWGLEFRTGSRLVKPEVVRNS